MASCVCETEVCDLELTPFSWRGIWLGERARCWCSEHDCWWVRAAKRQEQHRGRAEDPPPGRGARSFSPRAPAEISWTTTPRPGHATTGSHWSSTARIATRLS